MSRFNTGNNIGSLAEEDFYDNCLSLDQAMNSPASTWRDRFGVEKPTIDAALKSAGFMPAGFDFVTGGTLQPGDRNKAVYNPAPNGDNNWYRWNGEFPKEIAANSQPNPKNENNWVLAHFRIGIVEKEALRRTYLEVGLNLVEGSFEEGGVLVNSNDVLLQERTGKVFSGPIGTVAAGTDPTLPSSGYVSRTDVVLRGDLSAPGGAGLVGGLPVFVTATKYAGGATKSSTSNDAAITAAINDAIATGSFVYWPEVYEVQGNIPNFHSVRHDGPGGIKRGADVYTVAPTVQDTGTNTLYVSTVGAAGNDGLTASFAFSTIQAAFDALTNAGNDLIGDWAVSIAAGSYNQFSVLSGVKSRNRIAIHGPDVLGAVPIVTIDGTGLSSLSINGMLLTNGVYAKVSDIKFANWNGGSGVGPSDASTGLNASLYCNVWSDNCDFDLCGTGFGVTRSRVYQGRGRVTGCDTGSTAFGNTTCSYGYNGATAYSDCAIGVNIRDGSNGVIAGGSFDGCVVATRAVNQSHYRLSNCQFSNSGTADVYTYTGSSCFFGDGNTHTPGKKYKAQFSLDLEGGKQFYYDGDTGKFNLGAALTPGYKFHFRSESTGAFVSSACYACIEAPSPLLGFNGSDTGTFGLLLAKPGVSSEASLLYTAADGNWRIRAGNADSYRLAATVFRPVLDNTVTLGTGGSRWSVVYAGTGTINTSDAREKTSPLAIDDAILDAWGDVQLVTFQWLDSIRAKGEEFARWHFGVIAQQVRDAFVARGLDGTRYGLLCYDEWEDEFEPIIEIRKNEDSGELEEHPTGEMKLVLAAGNRWGIRPDQCLFLEAAYQRRRCDRIEGRLSAAGL